jgi:Skp family chaperone for outer membrane proteins
MMFRPKALLLLGSIFFSAALPLGAVAQQAPAQPAPAQQDPRTAFKVAVFDVEAIKANAAAFKDIRRQRQELLNTFNAERQKESETLRSAGEELSRQRAILSPEAFAEERRKLDQRAAEAERRLQVRAHQIDVVINNAVDVVEKALGQVVTELVKANNISLLFTRQAVAVVAQPLDATDEIMAALDKRLTTVKVANPNTIKVDSPPAPGQAPGAARSANPPAARAPAPAKPAPAR